MGSVAADDGKCTHSARQSDSAVANGSRPEISQEDMTWEPLQQLMQNATIVDQDLLDNAIIETNNLTHAFIEPDSHKKLHRTARPRRPGSQYCTQI